MTAVHPHADPVPWTLRAAAAVIAAEALAEALLVGGRTTLTVGLRVGLISCIGLKWVLAWRVQHRSAGAALGLLMLEGTTVVAALGAVEATATTRLALAAASLAAIVLLLSSLHAFPPPALPPHLNPPRGNP
jgi:hypothetical protein